MRWFSGETSAAMRTLHNYHQVWLQYGFTPEFYNIPQTEAGSNRENYPLRPELIESIMYLYRSTEDPYLLQAGVDILRSIQHSAKTPCGYATVSIQFSENCLHKANEIFANYLTFVIIIYENFNQLSDLRFFIYMFFLDKRCARSQKRRQNGIVFPR